MAKRCKRSLALRAKVDGSSALWHSWGNHIGEKRKFDESVDVAFRLGVNPSMQIKWFAVLAPLPHGTGKGVRVLVFAEGEAGRLATEAGAEFVGGEELIDKIKGGWTDFDKAVCNSFNDAKSWRVLG